MALCRRLSGSWRPRRAAYESATISVFLWTFVSEICCISVDSVLFLHLCSDTLPYSMFCIRSPVY